MPMSFPDFDSLKRRATQRGFRQPLKSESEQTFRNALAEHVSYIDRVESAEIRSGKGGDKMQENPAMLLAMMGIDTTSLFK